LIFASVAQPVRNRNKGCPQKTLKVFGNLQGLVVALLAWRLHETHRLDGVDTGSGFFIETSLRRNPFIGLNCGEQGKASRRYMLRLRMEYLAFVQ